MKNGLKFLEETIFKEDVMNRAERVLDYLHEFGSITQLDAIRDLGYTRLAPAISELKQSGIKIVTKREQSKNRRGQIVSYSRYFLGTNGEQNEI